MSARREDWHHRPSQPSRRNPSYAHRRKMSLPPTAARRHRHCPKWRVIDCVKLSNSAWRPARHRSRPLHNGLLPLLLLLQHRQRRDPNQQQQQARRVRAIDCVNWKMLGNCRSHRQQGSSRSFLLRLTLLPQKHKQCHRHPTVPAERQVQYKSPTCPNRNRFRFSGWYQTSHHRPHHLRWVQ